nr:hypothetical protein [Tanacetum cinerariifolium]
MAGENIDNLTMEQYLTLTRGNQAPGVVKPEIEVNVNFEIKSQFMRELREDTFSGNKNDDAHEHIERVLDIVSLFNISGVTRDAVAKQLEDIRNFKKEEKKHHTKLGKGPQGYYTHVDNRPPFGKKKVGLRRNYEQALVRIGIKKF